MLTLLYTDAVSSPLKKNLFVRVLRSAESQLSAHAEENPGDARPRILETEVELALVDDATIQELNRATRGFDKPTDVLSFSNREIQDPELRGAVAQGLGQIVISLPAAERNAEIMKQPLEEELKFLFLHGLLHMLGYDHQTPDEEFEMMSLAYGILGRPPYQKTT